MERPLWITRAMIERAARAIYRCSGWDRKWNEIDPSGRRRYRNSSRPQQISELRFSGTALPTGPDHRFSERGSRVGRRSPRC